MIYDGHTVRKRFSQNFLISDSVLSAMVNEIAPQKSDFICEIGPGLGALTHRLFELVSADSSLEKGITKIEDGKLFVIEIDKDLVFRLRLKYADKIEIFCSDALRFDFTNLYRSFCRENLARRLRIVGNLPYNISTSLLFHLKDSIDIVADQHFMLQKEVIDRMVAIPGTKFYGKLSVVLQHQYYLEKIFEISPSAFRPIPKVTSAVIRMVPKPFLKRKEVDEKVLSLLVNKAFSQRRKKIKNTLYSLQAKIPFDELGIDINKRAEDLTVEEYVSAAKKINLLDFYDSKDM